MGRVADGGEQRGGVVAWAHLRVEWTCVRGEYSRAALWRKLPELRLRAGARGGRACDVWTTKARSRRRSRSAKVAKVAKVAKAAKAAKAAKVAKVAKVAKGSRRGMGRRGGGLRLENAG